MNTPTDPRLCDWIASPLGVAAWREIMAELRRMQGVRWLPQVVPEVGVVGPAALRDYVAPHLWHPAVVPDALGHDCRYDRVLVAHALEDADPAALLATVAQVLRPDGTVVLVVPHRVGLWAMRPRWSPFGGGTPYTAGQLERALEAAGLRLVEKRYALWAPPLRVFWVGRGARVWQRVFRWLLKRRCPLLGGVLLAVAVKDAAGGKLLRVEKPLVRAKPRVAAVPTACDTGN